MTKARRFLMALGSIAVIGSLLAPVPAVSADSVKLTGCLVKAESDGDGYLLINPPMEPGATSRGNGSVTPGSVGTTPSFANIFYWLDKDTDLKPHVGHRVEIEGDLKGDFKQGEIKIDRKDNWTEIKVKSSGRDMEARVPNASVIAGPNPDHKIDVLVRRVDVEKVRMLDAMCR